MEKAKRRKYRSEGLYASYDGYKLKLRAPREGRSTLFIWNQVSCMNLKRMSQRLGKRTTIMTIARRQATDT
jgi:hypothetical protein